MEALLVSGSQAYAQVARDADVEFVAGIVD